MAVALVAGAVVSAAAQVFKGVQGYYEGRSTKEQLDAQAKRTEQESLAAANRIRSRSRRLAASQRARAAAAGVDLSGSVTDIQQDSAQQFEVDAMTELYKGSIQAASLRTQGNAAKKSGTLGLITSGASAVGTVLGGVGSYNALSTNPSFVGDINTGIAGSIA